MAVVEGEGLVRAYPGGDRLTPVLRGVDLRLAEGEFCCVVGPSGSGKTTLLNLVGALDIADEGELRVAGVALRPYDERRAAHLRRTRLGFVFQFYNLLPTLTLEENVVLAAEASGSRVSDARARAAVLLERVGLGARARAFPATLSGGEQQRGALVRAVLRRPALLLADEPTGNLDRAARDAVTGLLRELVREEGMACLVVSHDDAMARGADRVLRMEDGRLEATAP